MLPLSPGSVTLVLLDVVVGLASAKLLSRGNALSGELLVSSNTDLFEALLSAVELSAKLSADV